jgi:hypothetical protein
MSVLVAMICMNECLGFSFGTSGFLRFHQRGNVLLAAFDERAGGGGVAAVKGYLVGKYSNKLQAEKDHAAGKMTGAQGGHEFVTASLAEHSLLEDVVIATYYYGEDISAVFRYRLYELCALDTSEDSCRMKLYRPTLDHDEELKKTQYSTRTAPTMENFEYLQGCDVIWKKKVASSTDDGVFFEGTLEAGECVICSQQDPSRIVKVRDDLKLSAKELWINDRVYTTDGTMIIGNVEGVPYKLLRQQEEQD